MVLAKHNTLADITVVWFINTAPKNINKAV